MNVTLYKIKSIHNNLRTDMIKGIADRLPIVGKNFYMNAEGLEFGVRLIRTTPVKEVITIRKNRYHFKTNNSTYELQVH